MIAMPYILVDIVLGIISLLFFCVTSAALLSRYPVANFYLPASLRGRTLSFLAQGVVLSGLSIVAVYGVARVSRTHLLFDLLFFVGLVNAIVLAFQFMDRRYFLSTSKLRRWLVLGALSVVLTLVPALGVVIAVVGLLTIR
jgi:hypothetical protein